MLTRGQRQDGRRPARAPSPVAVERHARVRRFTESLCDGLSADDCQVQSLADASPVKWHLAHTTWFFEAFVLREARPDYRPFRAGFERLFNSYYHAVGPQYPRPRRGVLSQPSLDEVRAYRRHVDGAMTALLSAGASLAPAVAERVELGLQHEQQHQELILTDLKHAFSCNPLQPAYRAAPGAAAAPAPAPARWIERPGVLVEVGHDGTGFGFDHERPRHRAWTDAHALASRVVTNGEYLEFVREGGYRTASLWLSDGWALAQAEGWSRPLYWSEGLDATFTLAGKRTLDPAEAVCHLSYYEADAYARWAGARLPREEEWEAAAAAWPVEGNFVESGRLHASPPPDDHPGFFGNVWEWTASPYLAYPGYRPPAGALGEYNGKFMCNQMVLRGGSCASPASHLRASYRNFFPPHARWQFAGLRLAKDLT